MTSHALERRDPRSGRAMYRTPSVDVIESKSSLTLVIDLPGVDETGVEVETEKNRLTVVGRPAPLSEEGRAHLDELSTEEFRRDFRLDPSLDTSGIDATIRHGVLRLEIPKSERAQARRIEVR